MDMMLDKAVAPSGGDIGDGERAGTGPGGRSASGSDPPQESDVLVGARAEVPANLD